MVTKSNISKVLVLDIKTTGIGKESKPILVSYAIFPFLDGKLVHSSEWYSIENV